MNCFCIVVHKCQFLLSKQRSDYHNGSHWLTAVNIKIMLSAILAYQCNLSYDLIHWCFLTHYLILTNSSNDVITSHSVSTNVLRNFYFVISRLPFLQNQRTNRRCNCKFRSNELLLWMSTFLSNNFICRKEGCAIPLLVTSCIEELERRGVSTNC